MDSLPDRAAGARSLAVLSRFRADFHSCLTARADELCELADAVLCADGPVRNLAALSLAPGLLKDVWAIQGAKLGVNYGLNKVRFPAPVPVGSRIRMAAQLGAAEDAGVNAVQAVVDFTIEVEGGDKPACVAQGVYRYYA